MNFASKVKFLDELGKITIKYHEPGIWYAKVDGVEIAFLGFVASAFGTGKTPNDAVNAFWNELTALPEKYAVKFLKYNNDMTRKESHYCVWAKTQWKEVDYANDIRTTTSS